MKKIFTIILSLIICFSTFSLTACILGGPTGPVYSEEYDYDEEHHWRPLISGSETDPTYTDYSTHVNKKGKCVCGYYFECPYLSYRLNGRGGLICYGAADVENGYYYEYSTGGEYHSYEDKNGVDNIATNNWLHVEVPKYAEYEGTSYPVVELASYAFTLDMVESVKLNEGLLKIGSQAFSYSGVKEIRIPDSVTDIGHSLFYENSFIETVYYGANVTQIGGYNFYDCRNLKNVYLNDKINYIGISAFNNCSKLEYLIIPETCTSINVDWTSIEGLKYSPFQNCDPKVLKLYFKADAIPSTFPKEWNTDIIPYYLNGQWALDAKGVPYVL